MKNIFVILILVNSVFSKDITEITVGSKQNEIELQIYNDSEIKLNNVVVELLDVEEIYLFDKLRIVIPTIEPFYTKTALFTFGVDNSAELNSFDKLKFQIESLEQKWEKEIELKIIPPNKIKLTQNFPNPFNPSTTIIYSIPNPSADGVKQKTSNDLGIRQLPNKMFLQSINVDVKIYDILGREIATLVDQNQKPGIYEIIFDGRKFASGIYFYRLKAGDYTDVKKMILVK